jgi:Cu/Ag efflux protein CusF
MTNGIKRATAVTVAWTAMLILLLSGCNSAPPERHYTLQGEIVAIGPTKKLLTVQHGDIPGFMPAMTMSYTVAVPSEVDGLKVGDTITADLIVSNGRGRLEKITPVASAKPAPSAQQPAP